MKFIIRISAPDLGGYIAHASTTRDQRGPNIVGREAFARRFASYVDAECHVKNLGFRLADEPEPGETVCCVIEVAA